MYVYMEYVYTRDLPISGLPDSAISRISNQLTLDNHTSRSLRAWAVLLIQRPCPRVEGFL